MKLIHTENNDDWFEERRKRLTSTELASLHLTRSAANWYRIRAEKETGQHWAGNRNTTWGTGREKHIATALDPTLERGERDYEFMAADSRLRYNAEPQTIVVNEDDDRLCGTPDLFSEDGEVIGEIKTSGQPFTGGHYHYWCPDRYYLQIQANMWHAGAEACALAVEYYTEDEAGEFHITKKPEIKTILFRPSTAEELRATAAEWFAWLDGVTPEWMGEEVSLDDMDELAGLVEQLAEAQEKAKSWSDLATGYKARIEEIAAGKSFDTEIGGYVLKVSQISESTQTDMKALKAAHPDLVKKYQKPRAGYTRIKIEKETP